MTNDNDEPSNGVVTKRVLFDPRKLRHLRRERGMDPQDVGFKLKKMRLPATPYCYPGWCVVVGWEGGAIPIDVNSFLGVCRVLEIAPDDLLTEMPEPAPLPEPDDAPPLFQAQPAPGVTVEVRAVGTPRES